MREKERGEREDGGREDGEREDREREEAKIVNEFSFCSDRLGELEKEKNLLSERLIQQQKQTMAMEMDMLRKR